MVGRDAGRGEAAVTRIRSEVPGAEVRFAQADMSSINDVPALGASIAAEGPLDVLVNNVGGMYVDRLETKDGIERSLMLNHIAPMILTDALIGVLTRAAPSRIVNITSAAISASSMDFADIDAVGPYYGMAVTGRAKAMHLVHTNDLAEKLKVNGISVIAADPGGAATSNAAEMEVEMLPPPFRPYWDVISAGVQGSVADAAQSVVFAATNPSLDGRTGGRGRFGLHRRNGTGLSDRFRFDCGSEEAGRTPACTLGGHRRPLTIGLQHEVPVVQRSAASCH
ncbi:SDR family NAD(P)-dependent oxidoreductase [Rhodococcus sp. 06-235-1A]|uniref:SDR family NAD(P)-dependent oxidoreductase n=1 Tax=Rhodococcus sp. 06-235-1A TaxID=2022508 RepID=UPI00211B5F71|nr:SDR family NAD(P)-dependent oxidoreductase [Rhodococcus sp. 06-235-1A]